MIDSILAKWLLKRQRKSQIRKDIASRFRERLERAQTRDDKRKLLQEMEAEIKKAVSIAGLDKPIQYEVSKRVE